MRFSLFKPSLLYCLTALFLCLEMAVQISPNIMASDLMKDIKLNSLDLGLMSGAYFYTYALMQIPSGILLDKYRAKYVIVGALLLCSAGTYIFSCSTSLDSLMFSRLLMGAGSAFAFISVLVITADLFPHKFFSGITGITQLFACTGAICGTYCLNKIIMVYGWRQTMQIFMAIAVVLALLVGLFLNYPKQNRVRKNDPHPNLSIKKNLKQILGAPQTWWIGIYSFLMWSPMTGFASLWSVSFLKTVYNLSSHQAAFLTSFLWVGLAISGPLVGAGSEYFKSRKKSLILLSFVGFTSFGLILLGILSEKNLAICLLIIGASCSAQILCFTAIKENNSNEQKGLAVAINNIMVVLSGALYQPLIGWVLKKSDFYLQVSSLSPYSFKLALLPIFISYMTALFIAAFFIKETFKRNTAQTQ